MACNMRMFPLLLLLMQMLLLLVLPLPLRAEQDQPQPQPHPHRHPHPHSHNATTSAPMLRRNNLQQQRLQLLQQAQHQQHHHLRHEQHLRAEFAGDGNRQPPPPSSSPSEMFLQPGPGQQQHHLRHHNRHHVAWEQRVFPELQHRLLTTTTTTATPSTTDAPLQQHVTNNVSGGATTRYFDRDGIYAAWTQPRATRAPNWQLDEDDEDDDDEDEDDEDENYDEDEEDESAAAELAKQMPRYSLFSQKLPQISSQEEDYETNNEQNIEKDSFPVINLNKHPNVAGGHTKAANKRNIFDWLFKRNKNKSQKETKVQTITEKPKNLVELDENDESFASSSSSSSAEAFSNEQWNKIEHEHHLKQQKHQKELQALRDKNRNSPLIRGGDSSLRRGAIDNEVSAITESSEDNNEHDADTRKSMHKKVKPTTEEDRKQAALAKAHWVEVSRSIPCHKPQERFVRVQSSVSERYVPYGTNLSRCAEDTGCCSHRNEICAPKKTETVVKQFKVFGMTNHAEVKNVILINHVECHCIERSSYTPVESRPICNCPKFFETILQHDNICRCDCTSGNINCEKLKLGDEHFPINDRKCIKHKHCKAPSCMYGKYMENDGRCPKQLEQLTQQSNSFNSYNLS